MVILIADSDLKYDDTQDYGTPQAFVVVGITTSSAAADNATPTVTRSFTVCQTSQDNHRTMEATSLH